MSIKLKLFINVVISIVCLLGVGVSGFLFINRVANVSLSLVEEQTTALLILAEAEQNIWEAIVRINVHIGTTDPQKMENLEQELLRFSSEATSKVANHGQAERIKSHTEKDHKAFEAEWNKFIQIGNQAVEASKGYAKEHAMTLMSEKGKQEFDLALALIRSMSAEHRKRMSELRDEAVMTRKNSAMYLIVLSIISIIASLAASGLIAHSITKPINLIIEKLTEGSKKSEQVSDQTSMSGASLSENVSKQAAAIEEISSSVEQMSAATRKNADNAVETDKLTNTLQQIAKRVGQSLSNLTVSMKDISETGKQSQGIVKTIDEIAFLTRLLALNAAIEAARAGEAGAGFAVVADEVRNLALRASEAAKNTDSLIEIVIKKIEEAAVLTKKTDTDFSEVISSGSKTSNLVSDIALASVEQAQGIENISTAIDSIEKITQDNAANAEETALIAKEMSEQSVEIGEFVKQLNSIIRGN